VSWSLEDEKEIVMQLKRSSLTALLVMATAGLWGCPPRGPVPACPPCKYHVESGRLVGKFTGWNDTSGFPFKELVVTIKTTDGQLHPIPISDPSSFSPDVAFDVKVTNTITSNVALVSVVWKDNEGNDIAQAEVQLAP